MHNHSVQSTLNCSSEITVEYAKYDTNNMTDEESTKYATLINKHVKFSKTYNEEKLELLHAVIPCNRSFKFESHKYLQDLLEEK